MRLLLVGALVLGCAGAALAQEGGQERIDPPSASPPQDRGEPSAPAAPSQTGGKAGEGAVEFRVGYYDNADGDSEGNPFLDESLTDIEAVIVVEYQATDKLRLTLTGSYDFVSSASIDRLSNYPSQSGASGDNYFSGDLAATYAWSDDLRVGGHVGASFEYDYRSLGLGGRVEVDVAEDNATLSMALNAYFDSIDVIRFDGTNDGTDDRLSLSVNLGYYQVLSPTLHMSVGLNVTHQSGFLQTAYNGVVLEDPGRPLSEGIDPDLLLDLNRLPPGVAIEAEELPDTRLRSALFGEVRKSFSEIGTAVGVGSRLYMDSWGIASASLELKLYQWLIDDVLRARLRYRFYTQSAADDYEERFYVPLNQRSNNPLRPRRERTQDSDLSAFSSHTIGLKFVVLLSDRIALDVGGDYVLRSDGIDQLLFSLGLRWEF